MKKIAITTGDPNSVSPEIIIKALNFLDLPKDKVVLITNKNIADYYNKKLGLALEKEYETVEIPYKFNDVRPGEETEKSGEFAFKSIVTACNMAVNNQIDAIVTAPVSKNALKMAGHNYSGQTEILEQYLAHSDQKAEMLFMCENFCLMLLTRHIPLHTVNNFIKKDVIIDKISRLITSLQIQLGMPNPKIAICALNPHAGENSMFGDEEQNEIIPAVRYLQKSGVNISGPFPADSLFASLAQGNSQYNCYVAMYHDQGLIPVKMLQRDNCINTTIGLDILRTSPAHGTAFDIAGKNLANANSMINAVKLAVNK